MHFSSSPTPAFLFMALSGALFGGCAGSEPDQMAGERGCVSLQAGESKLIFSHEGPVDASYRLSRSSNPEPAYEAVVNLQLLSAQDYPVSKETLAAVRDRTVRCLSAVSETLLGPSGERLSIRLAQSSDRALGMPAEHFVEVSSVNTRNHSNRWSADIGCADTVHEVLHLLGLVDEYVEVEFSGKASYDCRHPGPPGSLMHQPALALAQVSASYEIRECRDQKVPCDDSSQVGFFSDRDLRFEFRGEEGDRTRFRSTLAQWLQGPAVLSEGEHPRFAVRQSPESSSALLPAQFRAIVRPNCVEENAVYYQCAADAYRSSAEKGGEGCLQSAPDACAGGKMDWLLK